MQKHLKKFNSKFTDSILKYGALAVLMVVPLYPKFPLLSIEGVSVSIRVEDILIFAVSIILMISLIRDRFRIVKSRIFLAFLLFFAVGAISLISASFVTQTVSMKTALLHLFRRIEYMTCFFIGWQAVKERGSFGLFIRAIVVVIAVVFVVGVGQKHFAWPVITTQNSEYSKGVALSYTEGGHLISTFAGHYDMANYLVLVLPILFVFLFAKDKPLREIFGNNTKLARLVILLTILAAYWLIVNAASRIPIVAYMISTSTVLIFIRRYKFIPIVLGISILMTGFSSNLIMRYTNIINVTVKNIISEVSIYKVAYAIESVDIETSPVAPQPAPIEDRSTSIRLRVEWPRAIRAFTKNPLLGTGYSSLTLATDNDYLRMLGEVGILGTAAFINIMAWVMKELFSKIKIPINNDDTEASSLYILAILSSIPALLLNMVFIDILEASKFAISFWLLLGVGSGVSYDKKHR